MNGEVALISKVKGLKRYPDRHQIPASHMYFINDKWLLSASDEDILVFTMDTYICIRKFDGPKSKIMRLTCNSSYISIALENNNILIYSVDFSFSASTPRLMRLTSGIVDINTGPSNSLFVSSIDTVNIYDLQSLEIKIQFKINGTVSTTAWDTENQEKSLLFVGTMEGELIIHTFSIKSNRLKQLGYCSLNGPVLAIKPSSLSLMVVTDKSVFYFQSGNFSPIIQFNVVLRPPSKLIVLPKSLICTSGTYIKMWKSVLKKAKVAKPKGRKIRYSNDDSIDHEIKNVIKESASDYLDRIRRHSNIVRYNGDNHGMSPIELEEYVAHLTLQDMHVKDIAHDDFGNINSSLTEEEMLQIALLISQESNNI